MAVLLGDTVTDETAQEEQTGEITLKKYSLLVRAWHFWELLSDQKGNWETNQFCPTLMYITKSKPFWSWAW